MRVAKLLSGSCMCRSIHWTVKDVRIGQILICHCELCRKSSGSMDVPFIALPKSAVWTQLEKSDTLQKYSSSNVADRYFCSKCGSFVCMDYSHEKSTVWLPMGTLSSSKENTSIETILDSTKDCHIFKEDQASFESALDALPREEYFGYYKSDCCSAGKEWDDLGDWKEEIDEGTTEKDVDDTKT